MHNLHGKFNRCSSLAAFTLVELLVVITIIGVLLTVGAVGLKNVSKSSGVTAGIPLAEGVFAEARTVASASGTNARVLISADPDDEERYLRYMMVAFESESGDWVAASRGIYLPQGVFLSQEYSLLNHQMGSGDIPSANHEIFSSADTSGGANSNLSGDYFYYEFNAEGISANAGASFIVGAGSRPPGATAPRVTSGSGVANFGGFVVWRKGTTSTFRHPDQMEIPDDIDNGDEF